jgi:HK97 family phage major capsid protein
VGQLLADGRNDLEGAALATGSGSGQPFGIVTALTGEASEVASATTDTFALADVNALWDALPARYQTNATWLANPIIYNEIRGFGAAGAPAPFITELKEEALIKRPMAVSSYMDSTYGSGENYILIVGDFANGYVVASRIGLQVELVPHLFAAANNRPSGQRGLFAWYRMGADSVAGDGDFALLNVT